MRTAQLAHFPNPLRPYPSQTSQSSHFSPAHTNTTSRAANKSSAHLHSPESPPPREIRAAYAGGRNLKVHNSTPDVLPGRSSRDPLRDRATTLRSLRYSSAVPFARENPAARATALQPLQ